VNGGSARLLFLLFHEDEYSTFLQNIDENKKTSNKLFATGELKLYIPSMALHNMM
jgi:hypothetical protein